MATDDYNNTVLFVELGQIAFDGIGLHASSKLAFDSLGEPPLGGSRQPASSGLGQAALDAYGQSLGKALDLSALNGLISCAQRAQLG